MLIQPAKAERKQPIGPENPGLAVAATEAAAEEGAAQGQLPSRRASRRRNNSKTSARRNRPLLSRKAPLNAPPRKHPLPPGLSASVGLRRLPPYRRLSKRLRTSLKL